MKVIPGELLKQFILYEDQRETELLVSLKEILKDQITRKNITWQKRMDIYEQIRKINEKLLK